MAVAIPTAPRARAPLSTRVSYTVWLCDPNGYRQRLISDYVSLKYNLSIRGGDGFSLKLPPTFDTRYVKELGYIEIWRTLGGRVPQLQDVFVIQNISEAMAPKGTTFLTLEGGSATEYFVGPNSRVVDQLVSTPGASYTDNADDLLKKFVHDQMGAGAGSTGTAEGRDLSVYAGFSVEAERGMGPSLTEDGYQRPLDDILKGLVRKSEENTSRPLRLFYRVRVKRFNPLRFEFVVLPQYFGRYRGFRSSSPVILSPQFGTISTVVRERDSREAYTSVFITYNGKAATTRITSTARRNIAPIGLREVVGDANLTGIESEAQDALRGKLNEGEPRELMRLGIIDSAVTRLGDHYGTGDVVGCIAFKRRFEVEVSNVEFSHDAGGETKTIRVDEL